MHKRMEWEIAANNITNQRWYQHTAIRSVDTYTQRFALRPLDVMLSMKLLLSGKTQIGTENLSEAL